MNDKTEIFVWLYCFQYKQNTVTLMEWIIDIVNH